MSEQRQANLKLSHFKHPWVRLSLAVLLAEITFFLFYREIGAFRQFSPLLVGTLAFGVAMTVYISFEVIRRRGRLNLRLVFAITTCVGIGLSMGSQQVSMAMQQRRMVEVVTRLGGRVYYHNHGSNDPYWLSTRSGWILPRWLIGVCGRDLFQDVWTVTLDGFDDDQLSAASFSALHGIESVAFGASALSGDGTAQLATKLRRLTSLTDLQIFEAGIPVEFLLELQELSSLRNLTFSHCKIEPGALKPVTRLQAIEFIRIDDCSLNLAELRSLSGLPNLKVLAVYGMNSSGLTGAEIADLKIALPGCDIWH